MGWQLEASGDWGTVVGSRAGQELGVSVVEDGLLKDRAGDPGSLVAVKDNESGEGAY